MAAENAAAGNGEAGFTLLEVVVALVASAFILAVVMNGAVTAREREGMARTKAEAVLLAQDLIAASVPAPLSLGARSGRAGKLSWEMQETAAAGDPGGRFVLTALSVAVRDAQGRLLFEGQTRSLKPAVRR